MSGKIDYMVYVGADHRGFGLKEKLKEWLRENGTATTDLGATEYNQEDDYPMIAIKLSERVALENSKGILVCGSGVGMVIAANKIRGVRAGLCLSTKQTMVARNDDDINILCLSTDLVSENDNLEIVKTFLETPFGSEDRFIRRINLIKQYESRIS